ncbi:hypothetical protein [Roseococcus pinisoli]|uniref:Uncharacterized protein n=1 Tax=Roseococcus pinisoli TaxID=2835040 RepID=A0ABS5Q8G0_9PROT|nr:hypothetical protein [Roseococcus pinisoli]MBS7809976.1 hypothetical protein [Roseococcus pinisoli]
MRRAALALLATVMAGPALAQERLVIPAGSGVVVPARGAASPRVVNAPRPTIPLRSAGTARPIAEGSGSLGSGLAAPALIALPIAALAAAVATMPGSGGGNASPTTAPARTR